MAFIHVAPVREEGWSKDAAVRASETSQVGEVVSRLLGDLSRLHSSQHPRLDYLDPAALDAVRRDPETYHLIGRAASSLEDAGERCVTTAYWPDEESNQVLVELEVAGDEVIWGPALAPVPAVTLSHHLRVTVDCRQGRVERLELA